LTIRPPEKVAGPFRVRMFEGPKAWAKLVLKLLSVRLKVPRLKAFPVRVVPAPLEPSVTVPVDAVTARVPVFEIVVPAPMVRPQGAAAPVERRLVVPAFVKAPLTVSEVEAAPPRVKVSPRLTLRLAKVAVPVRPTPPVPVI
jgi:hypothetical protein